MLDLTTPGMALNLSESFSLVADAYAKLTQLVLDISQEELEYAGTDGNSNSTATLLAHIAYTDLAFLYCINGEVLPPGDVLPPHLEMAYGPFEEADGTLSRVTGKSAVELLGRCQTVLGMIRAYLSSLPDGHASRPVSIPWWS